MFLHSKTISAFISRVRLDVREIVNNEMKLQMEVYADLMEYEKAAELRDQIQLLKRRHTRPSRASSP